MTGSIHETAVGLLQKSFGDAQRKGFRKAIQKLQWQVEGWCDPSDPVNWNDFIETGEAWKDGIIPDLWFFDEELMSVVCIEVEHGSPINNRKFEVYKNLWWHLDEFYWELHLLVSDRWCNLTPVPVHRYTSMGTADIETHRLGDVIAAERNKNEIMFELSNIYCLADKAMRETQRTEWIRRHPTFTQEAFLENRRLRDKSLSL